MIYFVIKNYVISHLHKFICVYIFFCIPFYLNAQINIKNWKLSGNASLNGGFYFFNGDSGLTARSSPFTYVASVNIITTYKNLIIPVSFTFSEQERKSRQAFNYFGIHPKWKWLTAHLGYSNISYSTYTLAGHTVFGAGLDMNPGLFRFGFIYGRFNRTILMSNNISSYYLPSYSRKGYSARIGVGTQKNYFDLIFLNVKDDSTTLTYNPVENRISPAQNLVGGFNSSFILIKDLVFDAEGAVSVITTNLKSDSINGVEDNVFSTKLNTIIPLNISTEFYSALRSAITYKKKKYSARILFLRIDPNYKSMGAYFFNNDVQNITFEPTAKFFKHKLYLRGSIGLQKDNLRNIKKATSHRTIGSLNISYNHSVKFGIDAGLSNYSCNQQSGRVALIDSIRLQQNTINYYLMPHYTINAKDMIHTIMINFNATKFNDKNTITERYTEFGLINIMMNYTLSLIPQKISYIAGVNYVNMDIYQFDSRMFGFVAGVSKSMKNNKFIMNISGCLNRAIYNNSKGWITNIFSSAQYKFDKKNSFNITVYMIENYFKKYPNMPIISSNKSFTELKFDVGYVYTL